MLLIFWCPELTKTSKNLQVFFLVFCDLGCLLLGCLLEPNLALFWEGFGWQVGPKILKKSILKLSRNQLKNQHLLESTIWIPKRGLASQNLPKPTMLIFSGASWKGFWCLLGASWVPLGANMAPKTPPRHHFGLIL